MVSCWLCFCFHREWDKMSLLLIIFKVRQRRRPTCNTCRLKNINIIAIATFFYYYIYFKRKWNVRPTIFLFLRICVFNHTWNNVFSINFVMHLPQNGTPSGTQAPWSQTLRDGPSNSNPRSHEYDATAPLSSVSSVNVTVLCAGAPGKLHFCAEIIEKRKEN